MSLHSTASDQDLIGLACNGCQDAIREFISRYQGKLMSFLSKRSSTQSDNEDILQETFTSAFNTLDSFDSTRSFSAWIFGIARNKANSHYRKISRAHKFITHDEAEYDTSTPSRQPDQVEQSQLFWDESKRLLSESQLAAMWLKYQENLSIAEIAHTLNKSEANIKIYLFRARKTLAQSSLLAEQHITHQDSHH